MQGINTGNLVLIQHLPILIDHKVDVSLTQKGLDPRQVTKIVAASFERGQIAQALQQLAGCQPLRRPGQTSTGRKN